jgi:hypothetical protein
MSSLDTLGWLKTTTLGKQWVVWTHLADSNGKSSPVRSTIHRSCYLAWDSTRSGENGGKLNNLAKATPRMPEEAATDL